MATKSDPGKLDELIAKLRQALQVDLVSVILYGSAASGDHSAKYSDINILCVLKQITPSQLAASESVFRWWQEQGNPSPLLLTEHELATSTDCFPIEFHDICRHHRILFGPDLVSGIEIDDLFYRAQVEHELRAKLLRLRQKASAILSDKDALRALLTDSFSTFCVLMRHALILHGIDSALPKRDMIERAGQRFDLKTAPFLTLLDLREERIRPKDVEPVPLLAEYIQEIGCMIDAMDVLERSQPGRDVA
jgi:predicted nucleotidyltransferase